MKETVMASLLGAVMAVAASETLAASERGTPAEAKALLQKAVAHYQSVGRKQALADFMGPKSKFIDRDLYVFCIDPNRIIVAHGASPMYVGATANLLKDVDGKAVGENIWRIGRSKGEGSVEYRMINPVSRKVELKISFMQKVGDDICGVGAYESQ